jgi:hypothetical protein
MHTIILPAQPSRFRTRTYADLRMTQGFQAAAWSAKAARMGTGAGRETARQGGR